MRYGVYYALHDRGQSIPSDRTVDMEIADIASQVLPALDGDGDYMGLVDQNGTTLQFIYYQESDRFWVEIPFLDEKASHGRWMNFEDCAELLRDLPKTFSIKAFSGFEYHPWRAPSP